MSIIASIKRLFDPIAHREEEREKKAERELSLTDAEGEPPEFYLPVAREQLKRTANDMGADLAGGYFKKSSFSHIVLADSVALLR